MHTNLSTIYPFESKSSETNIRFYSQDGYDTNHWARHIPTISDTNFIATLDIDGVLMGLKLNSSDARGYRGIACLVTKDESTMPSTFNRTYTFKENCALNTALVIFAEAYRRLGIFSVQTSIAGNNSQSINPDQSEQIGNAKEPSLLHGHIICRGNPEKCYIGNVPLRGPVMGLEMNLRGDGKEEGNASKVKWKNEELKIVAEAIGSEVLKILQSTDFLKHVKIISIISRSQIAPGLSSLFPPRFATLENTSQTNYTTPPELS